MSLSTRKEAAVKPSNGFSALVFGITNNLDSTVATTSSTKKLTTALAQEQSPIEKINIALKKAMTKTAYTDLTTVAMHYINREVATILAKHPHPIIKEFGKKSVTSHHENSAHLDTETGCVKSQVFVINMMMAGSYSGYIYWHKNNSWQYYNVTHPGYCNIQWQCHYGWATGGRAIPQAPNTFSLLTPTHVAALIGDIELIKSLEKMGIKIDEFDSSLNVTELELALIGNQPAMFDYLFDKMPKNNSPNALRYAIENNASREIIEKLSNIYTITDECLELAKKRDAQLGSFVEALRANIVATKFTSGGALLVMQYLLAFNPLESPNSLRNLICSHREIVAPNTNKRTGNSFLHDLILEKDINKVKAFMIAVEAASYIVELPFDIEAKNHAQQSVLQLSLEIGIKDITVAILIYGDPCITACEEKINTANILLADIQRERNKLMKKAANRLAQLQLSSMGVLQETTENLGDLAIQHTHTDMRLNRVIDVITQNPVTAQTNNRLFAPDKKAIESDGNHKQDNDIQTEIAQLREMMVTLQARLATLEKRVAADSHPRTVIPAHQ